MLKVLNRGTKNETKPIRHLIHHVNDRNNDLVILVCNRRMDYMDKMTREEAIEEIKYIQVASNKRINDALEMAIKALEQELCDKCEVGNPCLYCKHEFEPQESGDKE